jgi:iron only hydrogenase large subunit-like protein/nitrogen-specific signal transduction histidine kinase
MSHSKRKQLVFTVKDRCRVCYTCVRECPVKAIRIENGQAEVMNERCIGCGNCTIVCSQGAKVFLQTADDMKLMLDNTSNVVAIVAPSFPAEFPEIDDYKKFVGMVRALGFSHVCEVAFGADMVAREYKKLHEVTSSEGSISSDCPAIVFYIEHYHPNLVNHLAKVASPMVAMTRIVRKKYGIGTRVVFIGPCIAKKAESDEIDEAITFRELRALFKENKIRPDRVAATDFDPPHAGKGAIFPVSRGLLQTANISEDLLNENVIVASGRINFREAVREFESEAHERHHLELLCCRGCIMGPGMTKRGSRYSRRSEVSQFVRQRLQEIDLDQWQRDVEEFSTLDYSQSFEVQVRSHPMPSENEIEEVLRSIGKFEEKDHLNCGACGYDTCYEHAVAIVQGHAETEMCLPHSIEKLHSSVADLNESNLKLASTQQALKKSEKLASMGQLSAGIAHELNNPLGVITMYSNIVKDEIAEDNPLREDLDLIVEQAARCKKIVGGLLNFARKNQVNLTETNMIDFVRTSFLSIMKPENVLIDFKNKIKNPFANIDNDQMMQVLTNLEKNGVEAMPAGGKLTITLADDADNIIISITDEGVGISKENLEHLYTPFFTTKEIGKGTGLGLPLVYGIVKMHKGQIDVTTNADPQAGQTGTTFRIELPRA